MTRLTGTLVAAAGMFLLFSGSASAQPPRVDHYRGWGAQAVREVLGDLRRAEQNARYLNERDFRRIGFVRERLIEFERRWERGRFDSQALEEAHRALRNLVDSAPLRPRDRELLSEDVRRLHRIQERHEGR